MRHEAAVPVPLAEADHVPESATAPALAAANGLAGRLMVTSSPGWVGRSAIDRLSAGEHFERRGAAQIRVDGV